jgi:excisionase family DNA binding protein
MRTEPSTANVRRLPDRSSAVETLVGLPLMLTVDEAAGVLRISRTTAYKLVELHRSSAGRAGLPHVRLGGRVLVRRVDLAEIVGVPPDAA